MRKSSTGQRYFRRGYSLILAAISGLVLIGLMGLSLDTAWVYLNIERLQAAADAAALAGVNNLPQGTSTTQSHGRSAAAANSANGHPVLLAPNPNNDPDGDIVIGYWDSNHHTFTATTSSPNAIKTVARLTSTSPNGSLPLFFGGMFGVPSVNIACTAIATRQIVDDPGLLVLDPRRVSSFNISGNADITVDNGSVVVDASGSTALNISGNADIAASELNITGGYNISGNATLPGQDGTAGETNTGVPPTSDPLAGLTAPSTTGMTQYDASQGAFAGNQSPTLQPGYYTGGINLSGNVNATFDPGVYVIDGGFNVSGNVSISGQNVVFIVESGSLNLSGNGAVNLTPPASGPYQNITIFQPSTNTSSPSISGNGNMNMLGTLYFPTAELNLSGNAGATPIPGDQIICYDLNISGNAAFTIQTGARFGQVVMYLVQ